MNLPTIEEYLEDFALRCKSIKSIKELGSVKQRVLIGECPFLDCGFEKDLTFRSMRRFYRQNLEVLKPQLIHIIDTLIMEVT